MLSFGDDACPCSGQTLWADGQQQQAAGVAWDWIELRRGVVAMSDPMGVVTNLRLVDDHGDVLSQTAAAMHLHDLVHALPWQNEVRRALAGPA